MSIPVDIRENNIRELYPEEMAILLMDQTTGKNIFWATESYSSFKDGFQYNDQITMEHITGDVYGSVIQPRALKSREEQAKRVKNMAEVFTPSWVCNSQNNLIDNSWFGHENVFNEELIDEEGRHTWKSTEKKIQFSRSGKKSWKSYVRDVRLEITCGEGPYIVSRYDTVTGDLIPINMRIGILDRKLRVVGENTKSSSEWLTFAKEAIQATYGYEWQGDSLLLAREAIFVSFIEYYDAKFNSKPPIETLHEIAEIISWNLWQMDGLKLVIPGSCDEKFSETLFGGREKMICDACLKGDVKGHIGIPCEIMDWFAKDGPSKIQFQQLVH